MSDRNPHQPSMRHFFTNMQVPMPLPRKVFLLVRNLSLRLLHGDTCCGHPGEPGC